MKDVVLLVSEEFNSNPFEVPPEHIVSSRIVFVTTGISSKANTNTSLSEPPQSPSTCIVIVKSKKELKVIIGNLLSDVEFTNV